LRYGELNAITNAIRLRAVFQPLTQRRDPLYDELGNVIETHEHKGDFKER
jgi:hypothetical protein